MKMSTKGRYAVRILLGIARHQKNGPVPKKVIAKEECISADYIEQIIVPLKNEGLVVGLRGVKGGFKLAKETSKITVYDVLRASEGDMTLVDCARNECLGRDKTICVTRKVWEGASSFLAVYFSKITMKYMMDQEADLLKNRTASYTI
ncbi:MAG: Rrf2 family transcriptional regulator [Verrucomicrobia bacterium]|nr:Rrf2 family transcriptional regulator [Verrucomicrobiota bacterium]